MNFRYVVIFLLEFCMFALNFYEILSGVRDKFQKRMTCVAFSIKCAKNKFENCRKLKILKSVKIIQYYSIKFSFFNRPLFSQSSFQTDPSFNIIQYYSFVSLMETSALTAARRSLTCDQLACASRCEHALFAAIEKITSSSSKVVSCILLKFETYNV